MVDLGETRFTPWENAMIKLIVSAVLLLTACSEQSVPAPPQGTSQSNQQPVTDREDASGLAAALAPPAAAGESSDVLLPDLPLPRSLGMLAGKPMVLSPDGKWIAGTSGNTVVLWLAADGTKVREFVGHSSTVYGIAFSPDGKQIATSSYDDSVRLWDATTGTALKTLGRAGQDFEGIAYSPDGRLVASPNDDKSLWVWQTAGGEAKKLPAGTSSYQKVVAFSPDGETIASVGGTALILWDAETLTLRTKLTTNETSLAFSPSGDILATCGGGPVVKLRKPADGTLIRELHGDENTLAALSFSPAGEYLAASTSKGSSSAKRYDLLVWTVDTGKIVLRVPHDKALNWVTFLPKGNRLLTNSDELRVWDMAVLTDSDKRAAFTSYFNGEQDHYAAFIRRYLLGAEQKAFRLPYLGSKAGYVVTSITDRQGGTTEAVNVNVGRASIKRPLAMKIGVMNANVDASRLTAIEVIKVEDKTASLKLELQDGSETVATLAEDKVTGRCTFGEISLDMADIARMTFDFQHADEEAEEQPASEDAPCQAEILAVDGTRVSVTDVKLGNSHDLPVYVNGLIYMKINFKFVRNLDASLAPRGGIIVRLSLIGDRELIGFIPENQASGGVVGKTAFGDFTLPLAKLKSIRFR